MTKGKVTEKENQIHRRSLIFQPSLRTKNHAKPAVSGLFDTEAVTTAISAPKQLPHAQDVSTAVILRYLCWTLGQYDGFASSNFPCLT